MTKQISTLMCAVLLIAICVGNAFAQEKWSRDPRMTAVYASGTYVQLPQVKTDFQPAIQQTRIINTQQGTFVIPPNFRPHASAGNTQSECPLFRNKLVPNVLFGSANTVWPPNGFSGIGEGVYVTTNGGSSWYGYDTTLGGTPLNNHGGDPGIAIDNIGTFFMSHLGYTSSGMFANYSTNYGQTWSPSYTIVSGSTDKNLSGSDDAAASPYLGRSYTVWSNFALGAPPIVISYTTNRGVSWSSQFQINSPPSGHYSQGCDIAVGTAGQVYVTWAAPISASPYTEDFDGFAVSTNGGVSFTVTENAFDANGIRGYLSNHNSIRVDAFPRIAVDKSGGPRNGWIYIVGADKNLSPAGSDPDIILHSSSNGGTTWSSGIRVNQDALNNGASQWLAAVCVDDSGAVCVGYYDDRVGAPLAQFWMARSINGGSSWTEIQVSDHNFTPAPIPGLAGGYQGDYTGIASTNGKIYPWWCDNSSGFYQVWTCAVTLGPPPAHDIATGPFLGLPSLFVVNTPYAVKTKVANVGTSNETGISVKFYVNGTLTNTSSVNLNAGAIDSVSNTWTPSAIGTYTLKYIGTLGADTNHFNDTVQSTVTVLTSIPTMCPFLCSTPATYTAITGNAGPSGDDATVTVPIGFTFQYKSNAFTQASICTNGWLVLGSTTANSYTNDLSTVDPGLVNMITGFWDDMNTNNGGNIQYTTQGSAPNRTFIAQWANVAFFSGSGNITFQIVLHEAPSGVDGEVEIIYGTGVNNPSASGSVGINVTPGGSSNFTSITPGSSCSNTTYSTTSANNSVTYAFTSGTHYIFCNPVGIQHNQNSLPVTYSLSQNYPNPFNPETKIDFALPKAGLVKMVVYDILGAEVTTLVNENMQAGYHNVKFNGTNLASGVYFYRITAGDFTDVKKMLLVK